MPVGDLYIGNSAIYPGGTGVQISKVVIPLGTSVTIAAGTKRITATTSPTLNLVLQPGDQIELASVSTTNDGLYTVDVATTSYVQVLEALTDEGPVTNVSVKRLRRQ